MDINEKILADIREILEDDGDEYDVISDAAANEKIVPLGDRLIEAAKNGQFDTVKELLEKRAGDKDNGMSGVSALAAAVENGYADIVKILIGYGADVNAALAVAGPAAVKRLIEAGADVNARDEDGDTALIKAARNGYFDAVGALIDAGADINAKSKNGGTLLITVAWDGDTDLIRLLLDKGADVNAKDEYGNTALMKAARGGKFDIVKMLLDAGADADAKNNRGETLLMAAAAGGTPDIVRLFLDKGADVNAKDEDGDTVLTKCGNAKTVGMLISAGADVNAKNSDGDAALMREALRGHIENVKPLIAAGADANEVTSYGTTVLMELIRSAPYDADKIKNLLEEGMRVDMNAADNKGKTVLMYAVEGYCSPDFCRFLIKSGADISAKDKNGRSVLHYAAKNGGAYTDDVLKFLTEEYGADMNAPDNDGDTPAILLIKKGKYEKAIGEFGLDVNMKFKDDGHIRTPLMMAAAAGNIQACQWLADRGADVGAADEEGETAFSLALRRENSGVCFLLGEKLGMSREDVLKAFGGKNKAFFMKAVKKNDLAMCKKLYAYGADVNGDGESVFGFMSEQTPLIAAIERGYRDMCFWLVEAGADVNEKGPDKRTPLQTAEDYGQDEIAAFLREHGAQLRILNDDMFDAAEREDFERCKELIAQGADINARRKHFFFGDETLLAIAAEKGRFEWCEWLTAHGADPNTECDLWPQPLIRAAENGYGDIVRLLLDNGADIGAKDRKGKTALDHARENGHDEIVALLEKFVAK